MGRPAFTRSTRLASIVKEELAVMINGHQIKELKDPRIQGLISITEVVVTNGYQHMEIFLSIFEKENRAGILEVLNEANSSIRGEICRRLKLRFAPTIVFKLDESIERGFKVWDVLDQISEKGN